MSDEEIGAEDEHKSLRGEGVFPAGSVEQLVIEEVIEDKYLAFEEASQCLNTLGKDESGMRYAYLMITAVDRKLTDISTILSFPHLLFVDVSGNYLTMENLQVLTEMPYLILLKAQRNRIESSELQEMPYLQVLDLSKNQILETADIHQPMLEFLELNFNQIYTVRFDAERVPQLKQLEMRGNYLADVRGNFPPTLENLYLAENRISKIIDNDLAKLVNLKILHLRENYIRKLDGFTGSLHNLTYLNLRKNKIKKFRQFRKLQCLTALEVLIVMQNPVAGEAEEKAEGEEAAEDEEAEGEEDEAKDKSRIPLLIFLPNLKRINKVFVTFEERQKAREVKDEKYQEIMAEDSSDDETDTPNTSTGPTSTYTTDEESDA